MIRRATDISSDGSVRLWQAVVHQTLKDVLAAGKDQVDACHAVLDDHWLEICSFANMDGLKLRKGFLKLHPKLVQDKYDNAQDLLFSMHENGVSIAKINKAFTAAKSIELKFLQGGKK
jgi:hypothetical protein